MTTASASRPLTDALDPANPYSLVCLPLADLPPEIIGSPSLRRVKLVKSLSGERGLVTEVQQFQESSVTGVRSIEGAIREFHLPKEEALTLLALRGVAAFDIASRRLALMRLFHDDPARGQLIEDCAALRFDPDTRQKTEALTRKYTQALFANIFTDNPEGVRSVGELVARLDKLAASSDVAERKRAQAHVLHIQQRFRLQNVGDILPFFSEFELLATAIAHYRGCYLDLVPHMQQLHADLRALNQPEHELNAIMLAQVAHSLGEARSLIENFFQAFDTSFDAIVSSAEPDTFKCLQEYLQGAYAAIGTLLCSWGLRLQAAFAFTQQRRSLTPTSRIDMIREVICKHLNERGAGIGALSHATAFLRDAKHA